MPRSKGGKNANGNSKKGKNKRKATSPLLNEGSHSEIGGNSCATGNQECQVNKRKVIRESNLFASPSCVMDNKNNMSTSN